MISIRTYELNPRGKFHGYVENEILLSSNGLKDVYVTVPFNPSVTPCNLLFSNKTNAALAPLTFDYKDQGFWGFGFELNSIAQSKAQV
ncbi:hypothetical protein GCM10028868_36730 [Virgibacillus kimchii]